MAGQVSQSESQVIYRRLAAVAVRLLDVREEIDRLSAANTSMNFPVNLDPESGGNLTVAQAVTLFGELAKYRSWFDNATVAATGGEGSGTRRAALDPFILAEPLV
jgi:hypothetical protein